MADINAIVSEFRTIQGLAKFSSLISSFEYIYESEVNKQHGATNRSYPLMALLKNTDPAQPQFNRRWVVYPVTLQLYDTYKIAEKGTTSIEDKRAELQDVMQKYIEEFRTRNQTVSDFFMVEETAVTYSFVDNSKNDKLIGIQAVLQVRCFSDCDTA